MIRRIFGGIIAATGLLLVFVAANELWRALGDRTTFTNGIASHAVSLTGFDIAGPIGILAVVLIGGLLFATGCIIATPQQK